MIVDVTEEDIRLGRPHDGHSCPVATAIRRAVDDVLRGRPGNRTVDVGYTIVKIGTMPVLPLPIVAQEFVARYDLAPCRGLPFSFELPVEARLLF